MTRQQSRQRMLATSNNFYIWCGFSAIFGRQAAPVQAIAIGMNPTRGDRAIGIRAVFHALSELP